MVFNCQTTDFTCVGIGDISGYVFGNGMLLSRRTRLVAAFDHRHIFLDPNPDAETSFVERERLFRLPRSSWADYDPRLISFGGGVYSRTSKWVPVTPQVATVLGIDPGVEALTTEDLIKAILTAPVDLLWNGGIGTYVKASTEDHREVGDKGNDSVRVDANQVLARCVVEGGNLGWTQQARIEYAKHGGHINTDYIDNSAGVDTSDHEVNIKILLADEVASGRLGEDERNELLASMTDEGPPGAHPQHRPEPAPSASLRSVKAEWVEDWMRALRSPATSTDPGVAAVHRGDAGPHDEGRGLMAPNWPRCWRGPRSDGRTRPRTELPRTHTRGSAITYFPSCPRTVRRRDRRAPAAARDHHDHHGQPFREQPESPPPPLAQETDATSRRSSGRSWRQGRSSAWRAMPHQGRGRG